MEPSNHHFKPTIAALFMSVVVGCSAEITDTVSGRWYSVDEVAQGKSLFLDHCASCHGKAAEGTTDWRTTDANGIYPPPPLNGSAHGWHHSLASLEGTIAMGGAQFGGVMPGFAGTLSEAEARQTIAYFQSFWSDEVYARWREINDR